MNSKKQIIYPIGLQTFERVIDTGCLYIDKTDQVYSLVKGGVYYFLSRPRRFGKSLLLSTIEAYFQGRKELFKGLKIDALEKEWERYPVLHLDLNAENYSLDGAVEKILNRHLCAWEEIYGTVDEYETLSGRFTSVIRRAHKQMGKRVVILVDEYDKPLTATIDNERLNDVFRNQLRAFYGVLKSMDAHIRFAMLTGVTKFSRINIFSDLNQPDDISLTNDYHAICGITDDELDTYCRQPIEELAEANDVSYDEMREMLRRKYDGYHFSRKSVGVYNPFSLMKAFKHKELLNYWFETGTPTFLTILLRDSHISLEKLTTGMQSVDELGGKDNFRHNPLPMMYQTGYLTIKGYNEQFEEFQLGFPNEEVRSAFTKALVPAFLHNDQGETIFSSREFVKDLYAGRADIFMQRLQTLFANLDFSIAGDAERYFHNSLQVVFMMLGLNCRVERHTSDGIMDATVETDDYVYIFELKMDRSAEEALRQIDEKQYAAPFALSGKQIFKIGVNFSSTTRRIEKYLIE